MERLSLEVVARVPEESLATGASLIIAQDLLSSRQATAKRLEADLVVDAKMSFGERLKQASGTARGVGSDGAIEAAGPRRPSRKPPFGGKVSLNHEKSGRFPRRGTRPSRVYGAPCRQAE